MSDDPSEETGPLAGLPPADRTLLEHSPLELAVAEIRFEATPGELTAALGLELRDRLIALGHPMGPLDRAQQGQVAINIPMGGAPMPQVQSVAVGWRVQSVGGHSQVTLLPGMVAVQTSRYERWSVSLRPLLEAALGITADLLGPSLVGRIGLRYINRFADRTATSVDFWKDKIDERFLGPICHPVVGPLVRGTQQQIELSLGDAQGALMRHGPIIDPAADGAVSYLLDIDVFDTEPSAFVPADLALRTEYLNRTSASLFQQALTTDWFRGLLPRSQEVSP